MLLGTTAGLLIGALVVAVLLAPDGDDAGGDTNGDANASANESAASVPESGSSVASPAAAPATTLAGPAGVDPAAIWQPDTLYVALYGHPGAPVLGVMGEQDIDAAIARAREVASGYEGLGRPVVPSFEIIVTVASFEEGGDGDYSNEYSDEKFIPWIEAAGAAGMHVVVDLQSGRDTFVNQAEEIEALLLYPHVSLALDPEWRVGPDGVPGGGFIGTVSAAEVNETIEYLDDLVVTNDLPAKLLVLHQFRPQMITDKQTIIGTDGVKVLVQMDGFGTLDNKLESWRQMVEDLPPGALTGWKNFYDEDSPTPTPAQSVAVEPQPVYISYQ